MDHHKICCENSGRTNQSARWVTRVGPSKCGPQQVRDPMPDLRAGPLWTAVLWRHRAQSTWSVCMYMITQEFLLFGWGLGTTQVSLVTSMFMSNSMLLWWALDSVPLPVVIKPKFAKKALQWRSERRAQVQSHVNQTEL